MVKEFRFTQYPIVTDRQTHGHFATVNTAPCITLRGKFFFMEMDSFWGLIKICWLKFISCFCCSWTWT